MDKWFTNFIFYLLPHWRLYSTPWLRLWQENQKQTDISIIRFSLIVFSLTYLAHHFFVDKPLGLTEDNRWLWYRFGLTFAGIFCFLLTYVKSTSLKPISYKTPILILGIVASYMQTLSMLWYADIPYLWGILIPIIFTAILKINTLASLAYCLLIYALQFNHYLESGLELPLILGACFTGLIFVAIIKRNMSTDIANFIKNQEKIEIERKLVESKKQMTEQVQGFLPRIINERISKNIEERKMSVIQAVDEELRPKERMISCFYSDIRSYTQLSKDPNFVRSAVIPDTHEAIAIIEDFNGVPRTIGDLVFAYFDNDKIEMNVIRNILAANEIHEATKLRNKDKESNQKITRFLIMTVGQAIVGNIGGSGSAREITALGSCVNKSARIDEFTKHEDVKKIVSTEGVLMDQSAYFILADYVDASFFNKVDLNNLTHDLRDFENEEQLWFLKLDPSVVYDLENQLNNLIKIDKTRGAA